MPVSSRLSRSLHATLGEPAADDLMTWMSSVEGSRSELRQIHADAMARIDSRFAEHEAKVDAVEHRLSASITTLRADMEVRFSKVDARFFELDAKLDRRCSEIEAKIDLRFADLIKWSFVFWCGTMALSVISVWLIRRGG